MKNLLYRPEQNFSLIIKCIVEIMAGILKSSYTTGIVHRHGKNGVKTYTYFTISAFLLILCLCSKTAETV